MWNLVATIGTVILGVGILVFFINALVIHRREPAAPLDPWDARSLEWLTTSPPKVHNFDRTPTVHALDEVFHRKYEDVGEDGEHNYVRRSTLEEIVAEEEAKGDAHVHLPAPSYWPLVLAFAIPIMAYGVIYTTWLIVLGAAVAVAAMFGWALEPADAEDSDFDPPAAGDETSKELANV